MNEDQVRKTPMPRYCRYKLLLCTVGYITLSAHIGFIYHCEQPYCHIKPWKLYTKHNKWVFFVFLLHKRYWAIYWDRLTAHIIYSQRTEQRHSAQRAIWSLTGKEKWMRTKCVCWPRYLSNKAEKPSKKQTFSSPQCPEEVILPSYLLETLFFSGFQSHLDQQQKLFPEVQRNQRLCSDVIDEDCSSAGAEGCRTETPLSQAALRGGNHQHAPLHHLQPINRLLSAPRRRHGAVCSCQCLISTDSYCCTWALFHARRSFCCRY